MSQLEKMINAVIAVHAIREGAYKRIPDDLRGFSFYGHNIWWSYVAVFDDVLCDECENMLEIGLFNGDKLRDVFPQHVITDENTIKVLVHLNCRCYLMRAEED